MRIFDFIKIFRNKPKATKSADPEFPLLHYKEFALLRADRNTGIVLNEKLEYANRDHGTMFKKFSNLELAINTAKKIVNTNPTVEVCIYDHKQQVVYFIDVKYEKFHNADLEFNFQLKQLNASTATMALLTFLIDGNRDSILDSSSYMTDNVDFKLGEAYPDMTYNELETHPHMVAEMRYQLELLT